MTMSDIIHAKLTQALAPETVEVIDESDQHIGHAGHDGRGESHFRVKVVSSRFENCTRLARHRLINEALSDELEGRIHALSIAALTPEEAAADPLND